MMYSAGFVLGVIGLMAFIAGLAWYIYNRCKNVPAKPPIILTGTALILCITGYLLTPTGMANIKLIISNIIK